MPAVTGKWNASDLATRLNIAAFAVDDTLSEKFATPTSVRVRRKRSGDILSFKIKDEALLKSEEFWAVLKETHDDFIKG